MSQRQSGPSTSSLKPSARRSSRNIVLYSIVDATSTMTSTSSVARIGGAAGSVTKRLVVAPPRKTTRLRRWERLRATRSSRSTFAALALTAHARSAHEAAPQPSFALAPVRHEERRRAQDNHTTADRAELREPLNGRSADRSLRGPVPRDLAKLAATDRQRESASEEQAPRVQ